MNKLADINSTFFKDLPTTLRQLRSLRNIIQCLKKVLKDQGLSLPYLGISTLDILSVSLVKQCLIFKST